MREVVHSSGQGKKIASCELRLCADKFVFKTAFLLSDWSIQKQKNLSKFKVYDLQFTTIRFIYN